MVHIITVSYRLDTEVPEENSEGGFKKVRRGALFEIENYHPDVEIEKY